MSEFYKKKSNLIIKNYKYLGIKERVSFYICRSFIIILAVVLYYYVDLLNNSENNKEAVLTIFILVGSIFVLYCVSKSDNKKHHEDKMNAVFQFVEEPDINIEVVNGLIEEIERYIKKTKTFALWITGLSATFIIFLATLTTNYFIKIFDVYLKVIPSDELLRLIENISQSGHVNENVMEFLNIGSMLLFVFLIVILIIYNFFAIFTFVREQILVFLFDVRYEILSNVNENKKVV